MVLWEVLERTRIYLPQFGGVSMSVSGPIGRYWNALESPDNPLIALRLFRDRIMTHSPTGRFYADLLEQNNAELVTALISSDALIQTVTQEYPPWLEAIQALLDGTGEGYVITAEMVAGMQAILDGFKENGGEDLRETIEFEENRLGISSLAGLTMNEFLAQVTERGGVLHELNFAQYADGPTITSDIVVYNPSQTETATGSVDLFDLDGDAIDPALVLVEGNSTFELPPLGSVTFAGRGSSDQLRVGSATVKADRPVSGVIRFFIKGVGVAGVGSSAPIMEVVAPVRRQGRLSTGVAIQNNVNEEITVDLQLKDEDGVEVGGGSSQRTIPAWGRLAEFIETLFPEADTTGFKGVITVRSQAGTIAVIALELETGAEPKFTTLPVSPLEP